LKGEATLSGLIARLISASSMVAPTGFGSQASLFEIAFEGLALAAKPAFMMSPNRCDRPE